MRAGMPRFSLYISTVWMIARTGNLAAPELRSPIVLFALISVIERERDVVNELPFLEQPILRKVTKI